MTTGHSTSTAVNPDALKTIRTEIIDLIVATGQANCPTVTAIINKLALSAFCGKPERRPLQGPAGITTALEQNITAN